MPLAFARRLTGRKRSAAADRQLGFALAFVAGAINAGGFLAVQQYTSHMTGIVSAMADNLALGAFDLVWVGVGGLLSFLAGAACSAIMVNMARQRQLNSEYAFPLMLEALLLLSFGVLGARLTEVQGLFVPVTVMLLCFIMGLQNAVITKLSGSAIRTTHITGVVTDIGIELGKLLYWNIGRPSGLVKVLADRQRLGVLMRLALAFFCGGVTGALGFNQLGYISTLPLALLLFGLAGVPAMDDLLVLGRAWRNKLRRYAGVWRRCRHVTAGDAIGADALASAFPLARERVASLQTSLQESEGAPVALIETHISWVLLAQTLAYKLKKPVQLPFLDFSTLAARRHFCEEELRLNRRMAPTLYLDVVDVRDGAQGPIFGGDGPVVDVAVRMRRFPDGALWSEMLAAGTLESQHVDAMAQTLTAFHRDAAVAPVGSAFGLAPAHQRVVQGLVDGIEPSLKQNATPEGLVEWPALRAWLAQQQQALSPLWSARQREGRVRECHGDLHLSNVLQLAGQPTAFDGIEFNAEMRWIDVLDDMAFLAMDLLANQRRALAFRFINAYLAASGDYGGLPSLRYYMVCRALVRARVAALAGQQGVPSTTASGAAQYLALAVALSRGADSRLAITHGLPGSGKSFVAQAVIEAVGAIGVRSDVERMRLFGLGALESSRGRVPGGIYDLETTRRTYSRLLQTARVALSAGWPVVVDAAFLRRAERNEFAALAASLAVPFTIFDCQAELPLLRRRLEHRQAGGADPSEADAAVLDHLTGVDEGLGDSESVRAIAIDAAQPASSSALARRWLAAAVLPEPTP